MWFQQGGLLVSRNLQGIAAKDHACAAQSWRLVVKVSATMFNATSYTLLHLYLPASAILWKVRCGRYREDGLEPARNSLWLSRCRSRTIYTKILVTRDDVRAISSGC